MTLTLTLATWIACGWLIYRWLRQYVDMSAVTALAVLLPLWPFVLATAVIRWLLERPDKATFRR